MSHSHDSGLRWPVRKRLVIGPIPGGDTYLCLSTRKEGHIALHMAVSRYVDLYVGIP